MIFDFIHHFSIICRVLLTVAAPSVWGVTLKRMAKVRTIQISDSINFEWEI